MRVKDVMTSTVVSVGPEMSLRDVAAVLADRCISGLPVVSERGLVLGVVSEADIVAQERAEQPSGRLHRRPHAVHPRTAGDAMTAPPITISPERPIAVAAGLMVDRQVNRLPVVDGDGVLAGIVTRADLVRAYARSDDEIVREIRDEVLKRALWISPGVVDVTSKRGEVHLRGQVETKVEAEVLEALVERVPGVVAVEAELTYAEQ